MPCSEAGLCLFFWFLARFFTLTLFEGCFSLKESLVKGNPHLNLTPSNQNQRAFPHEMMRIDSSKLTSRPSSLARWPYWRWLDFFRSQICLPTGIWASSIIHSHLWTQRQRQPTTNNLNKRQPKTNNKQLTANSQQPQQATANIMGI